MLIDLRTYTFHPGKLGEFLKLSEAEILPLQTKYCGTCLFYSTSETGTLNQLVQAWVYVDAADRDARRAAPGRPRAAADRAPGKPAAQANLVLAGAVGLRQRLRDDPDP